MQKCGRALKERQLAIQFGWLLAQGIFAFTLHRNPRQISWLDKKPSTKVASIQNTEKHCILQEECAISLNAPDRQSSGNMTVNVELAVVALHRFGFARFW